jgi:hypothetical protein
MPSICRNKKWMAFAATLHLATLAEGPELVPESEGDRLRFPTLQSRPIKNDPGYTDLGAENAEKHASTAPTLHLYGVWGKPQFRSSLYSEYF